MKIREDSLSVMDRHGRDNPSGGGFNISLTWKLLIKSYSSYKLRNCHKNNAANPHTNPKMNALFHQETN
jgi:hypothetical protein